MYIVYDDANIFGLVRDRNPEDLARIFNKYKINISDYVELPYSLEYIGQNYIYVCKNGTINDQKTKTDIWYDNIDDAEDYANRVACEVWRYEFRTISTTSGDILQYYEHLIHEAKRDSFAEQDQESMEDQESDQESMEDSDQESNVTTETLVFTDLNDDLATYG